MVNQGHISELILVLDIGRRKRKDVKDRKGGVASCRSKTGDSFSGGKLIFYISVSPAKFLGAHPNCLRY